MSYIPFTFPGEVTGNYPQRSILRQWYLPTAPYVLLNNSSIVDWPRAVLSLLTKHNLLLYKGNNRKTGVKLLKILA